MTEYDYVTELKKLALEIVRQSVDQKISIDDATDNVIGSHAWVTWFEDAQKVVNVSKSVEDAYPEVKHNSYSYAALIPNLAYECMVEDSKEYIEVYKSIAP